MQKLNPEQLQKLQKNAKNIRNICILAHVDHGKTTLTDDLISTNGIISPKLAGKIWYMDNTDAEQRKRITMKASSIALLYKHKTKRREIQTEEDYLINLVDSPGHVDFSGEVSTAVRLTDGGIVVVDVVEGVCIQTQAVIRQAWSEKVHPCLVLNKIDRLVTELHLSPAEAYERLKTILEQVNVICSTLWKEELAVLYEARAAKETSKSGDWVVEDDDDSDVYFSPERGNVAFASAGDGWAFRINQFADIYAEKLGIRRRVLLKTLWGEHYMNAKSKRIVTRNPTGNLTPMFVKFILNNIWEVYTAIMEQNMKKIGAIVKSLKLPLQSKDLRIENVQESAQAILGKWLPISNAVLGMVVEILPSPVAAQPRRMPKLWSPASALDLKTLSQEDRRTYRRMVHSVMSCDTSEEAPVIAYVAKVFALDRATALPPKNAAVIRQPRGPRARPAARTEAAVEEPKQPKEEVEKEKEAEKSAGPTDQGDARSGRLKDKEREELEMEAHRLAAGTTEEDGEEDNPMSIKRKTKRKHVAESSGADDKMWVAFARIFSGVLKEGSKVYVLGPRYDPRTPNLHRSVVEIKELYMLMGRELERVPSVSAGCVFGIGGVDDIILKTATLSTCKLCPPFSNMTFGFSPILRVAIEPKIPGEMPKLVEGLRLLNQADPCVEILVQESGEHVILASGELHLERCLEDLKTRFAKIEMEVYPPVVSFRETIIADLAKDATTDLVEGATPNKKCIVQLRAVPIPSNITAFLETAANQNVLRQLQVKNQVSLEGKIKAKEAERAKEDENVPEGKEGVEGEQEESEYLENFKKELFAEFEKADNGAYWLNELKNHLWSFGPKRVGANLLLNHVEGYHGTRHWKSLALKLGLISTSDTSPQEGDDEANAVGDIIKRYDNSIVSGFQMATAAGPLCEEPVTGIAFIVESVELTEDESEGNGVQGPFWGQIMSTVKDTCRAAFMRHGVRIVEPMYLCDLQVSVAALGKATMVLSRRRGRITHQDIRPGTDYFSMRAFLPVLGSFKFAEEIRDTTSGAASAQLVFSHWEVLDSDPFFVPTTEEEKEEFGESVESLPPPLSRTIIDDVRRRKGLPVKEKVVEKAEQQRNLSRKK